MTREQAVKLVRKIESSEGWVRFFEDAGVLKFEEPPAKTLNSESRFELILRHYGTSTASLIGILRAMDEQGLKVVEKNSADALRRMLHEYDADLDIHQAAIFDQVRKL